MAELPERRASTRSTRRSRRCSEPMRKRSSSPTWSCTRTKNAYVSVMRGQGTGSKPALLRVDGAGKIEVVSFENLKHTKVTLPNAPNAGTNPQRDPRQQSITDMAFSDGRLYIAGLSNEEFASKLRSVKYPFAPTMAPASRSSTAITVSSRRGRRSTRSCRIRSTTRRTWLPRTCARRW